ncbi:hypothetical protein N9B20_01145 [Mariniblastus sp.]|nr:hypothetical protein [Mariniblastus sp.]
MSETSSMTSVPAIAYGIDIGVYRHTQAGTVRGVSQSTFAWARAESDVAMSYDSGRFEFKNSFQVGRNFADLADLIQNDVLQNKRIAIGIEAPMWQPSPDEIPQGEFSLFEPRFACERGCEWYLQSGASATVKAISIGKLLLSLANLGEKTTFSTYVSQSSDIVLFEGFVVGDWKLPGAEEFSEGAHAWDALTTAAAFHYSQGSEKQAGLAVIHDWGSIKEPVVSHWKTIVQEAGLSGIHCDKDCAVVGFNSKDEDVLQKFSDQTYHTVEGN